MQKLFLFAFLIPIGLWAGEQKVVVVDVLGPDRGFAKSNYMSMIQDKSGFLWISTQTGLIQYSGSTIKRWVPGISEADELEAEFFYQALEDSRQNLWFATRNGFYLLGADRKNIKGFFSNGKPSQSLPNNRIFNLLAYNDSVLFLACDRSGIVRFNTIPHSIKLLNPTPTADDINVKDVWVRQYFKQSDTCIYLRTSLGYFQYNPVRNTIGRIVDHTVGLFPASGMSGLFQDYDGAFWFFNRKGELCFWIPGIKLQCIRNPIIQKQLSIGEVRLFNYDTLHLLVATVNGNYLFNRNDKNLIPLRFRGMFGDELSSDPVTAVFRTRDDNLFRHF